MFYSILDPTTISFDFELRGNDANRTVAENLKPFRDSCHYNCILLVTH